MSLPKINANIHNVSMDYFLRGVDAAKQQDAAATASTSSSPAPQQMTIGRLFPNQNVHG